MFKQTKILTLILFLGLFTQKSLVDAGCTCTAVNSLVTDTWCDSTCYTGAGVNQACDPSTAQEFLFCECSGCGDGDSSSAGSTSEGDVEIDMSKPCVCTSKLERIKDKWCAENCYSSAGVNDACKSDTNVNYQMCECTNCKPGSDSLKDFEDPDDKPEGKYYEWTEFTHDMFDNWPDFERTDKWELVLEKEQPLGQFSFFCSQKVAGGQGRWGNINWWRDLTIAKATYTGLPDHVKLKIKYNLLKYGTWADDESVELYINDNIVKVHTFAEGEACSEAEHKDEAVIELKHTDSEIKIEFRTGFDEKSEIWTQAWGISDFYIYTAEENECRFGCATCASPLKGWCDSCEVGHELKDGDCEAIGGDILFERNFYTHDFESDGWDILNFFEEAPKTKPYTYCLDTLVRFDNIRMLGGASAFCNTDFGEARSEISKTFSNLPDHWQVKVEYDLHFMYADTEWGADEAITARSGWTELAVSYQQDEGTDQLDCGKTKHKLVHVSAEMPHFEPDFDIKFDTNLKFEGCYSHSWGISDFKLYLSMCDPSCATCSGGGEKDCFSCRPSDAYVDGGCEKGADCDLNQFIELNTCQDCNEACNECEGDLAKLGEGGCIECAEGFEVNEIGDCYKCLGFMVGEICKSCNNACKTCDGPTAFLNSNWGCLTCNEGYYEGLNDECVQCDSTCKSCEKKPEFCTSCTDGADLTPTLSCECKKGYEKGMNGECVKCDDTCLTCDLESPDVCESCPDGKSLEDGKCYCAEGLLLNEREGTCVESC